MSLRLSNFAPKARSAQFQDHASCRSCHMAGRCLPNERCAIRVKVTTWGGVEERVVFWPPEAPKRATKPGLALRPHKIGFPE